MKRQAFLFFILTGSWARANVAGDLTHLFSPAKGQDDFISVASSQLLPKDQIRFHLFLDSAQNLLPGGSDANGQAYSTSDSLKSSYFGAAFRYGESCEFGIQTSFLMMQNAQRPPQTPQFAATGLTNVETELKVRVLKRESVGLSIVSALNFNRVENNPYQEKQKEINPTLQLAADTQLSSILLGINVGYLWRQNADRDIDTSPDYGNQFLFSAAAAIPFGEKWTGTLESYGATTPGDHSPANEKMLGLKYRPHSELTFDMGAAFRTEKGLFAAESRFFAGLRWSWNYSTPSSPPEKPSEPVADPKTDKIYIQENLLATVHFDSGSATIGKKEAQKLKATIAILNENPDGTRLRLIGRADSRGSEDANRAISEKRAIAVENFLKENGLRPGISADVVNYGAQKPLATNLTSLGRQLNRQVGIFIVPFGL